MVKVQIVDGDDQGLLSDRDPQPTVYGSVHIDEYPVVSVELFEYSPALQPLRSNRGIPFRARRGKCQIGPTNQGMKKDVFNRSRPLDAQGSDGCGRGLLSDGSTRDCVSYLFSLIPGTDSERRRNNHADKKSESKNPVAIVLPYVHNNLKADQTPLPFGVLHFGGVRRTHSVAACVEVQQKTERSDDFLRHWRLEFIALRPLIRSSGVVRQIRSWGDGSG